MNYELNFSPPTCRHIATLTLHPNEVETALGERFSPEKSRAKEEARAMRGRSSATTTQVLKRTEIRILHKRFGK